MRAHLMALAAAIGLAACGETQDAAAGDHLRCDITYEMLAGSFALESRAVIDIDLDLNEARDAGAWTTSYVRVTHPWEGRGEMDPWAIFVEGRSRPLVAVDGDVLTLFEAGAEERGFTVNLDNGDVNWTQSGTGGDVEYYGGCAPRPAGS